jgi:hypothetical protein
MRKAWRITRAGLRAMGSLGLAAGLFGVLAGMLTLFPVMLLDMMTLGSMRPASVQWLRDVVSLHYTLPEIRTAWTVHAPALWDHICFAWFAMVLLGAWSLGCAIMSAPIVLRARPPRKDEKR